MDAGDDNVLPWRKLSVEGHDTHLYIVQLPERDERRPIEWVFSRALEHFLWGGSPSSNLNHALRDLRLDGSRRSVSSTDPASQGLSVPQWAQLKGLYHAWSKEVDPLVRPMWRQVVLLPKAIAIQVIRHRSELRLEALALLRALGEAPPQHLADEEERRENEAQGVINLSLPDPGESDPGKDEMVETALGQELFDVFADDTEAIHVEQEQTRQYALTNPSQRLQTELKQFKAYRTQVLHASRSSNAVTSTTTEADHGVMLRYLGYIGRHYHHAALNFSIFRDANIQEMLQAFAQDWLVEERGVSFSTVASYCNSLLTLCRFAIGQIHQERDEATDELALVSLANLRSQSEAKAKDDGRYRALDPNWISFEDAQLTRISCERALAELGPPTSHQEHEKRVKLAQQCAILGLLTLQPPDRVGILRRLALGTTLVHEGDQDGWVIDLRNFRHKTSKVGIQRSTRAPPLVASL